MIHAVSDSARPRTALCTCAAMLAIVLGNGTTRAQTTQPAVIKWSARAIDDRKVEVPATLTTVLVFVMPDQARSAQVARQIKEQLGRRSDLTVAAVVSGDDAVAKARQFAQANQWSWPIIADAGYETSSHFVVRAWPTTFVLRPTGEEAGHIAGAPGSFSRDLEAYADFAQGAIDRAALTARLASSRVVAGSDQDLAQRHLHLAERLLDKGQLDEAREELRRGLKARPDDPPLRLMLARVHVLARQPDEAIRILESLPAQSVPAGPLGVLRGRALMLQGKTDQARTVLTDALRLNPDPAEAHYCLGLIHAEGRDWARAAEQFRLAFESTAAGRRVGAPATSPAGGR